MAIDPTDLIIFAVGGIVILLAALRLIPRIMEGTKAMQDFDDKMNEGLSSNHLFREGGNR